MKHKKLDKILYIRISEEMHTRARVQAAREKCTLQKWVVELIENKLNRLKISSKWLCLECGRWNLRGTQVAALGKCEECGKEDVAVFPCWEKID